ncbi:MAG: hypothetical protein JJ896_03480 [Rhodothermales bacterium]|nr:hypothetical protein [Rhodothermales bacterium]MBO6778695.1 hypothetical protein [Rhodothermales bacterium]
MSVRVLRFHLAAVLVAVVALLLGLDPADSPSDAARFFGRFHPALVHLPIGVLVVAVLAEFVGPEQAWAQRLYLLGAWIGVVALAAGLSMAQAGGYEAETLRWHKFGAVGLTVFAVAMPLLPRLASLVVLPLLVVVGHEGGSLTHGPDFLSEHAPAALRPVLGSPAPGLRLGDPDTTTVFSGVVQPILEASCTSCHGAGRMRGNLDLRSRDGIEAGGGDGAVVLAGRPEASPLIQRTLLPPGEEKVMPPRDGPVLSPSHARLLAWWVADGASFERTLAEAGLPPDVQQILEAAGLGAVRTGVWALDVEPAMEEMIYALTSRGARVQPVAEGEPFLQVRCDTAEACLGDGGRALLGLADQVVWLDMARSDVTDVSALAGMRHLEKIWLQKTGVVDVSALAGLEYLEYLNLSETAVEDASAVEHVPGLYLWGSPAGEL